MIVGLSAAWPAGRAGEEEGVVRLLGGGFGGGAGDAGVAAGYGLPQLRRGKMAAESHTQLRWSTFLSAGCRPLAFMGTTDSFLVKVTATRVSPPPG